ncbi:MAG TPA: hypothetical protein VFE97_05210, partial [Methylomirabilota bacterium]|nr:hypothetical protein [Methylomirabilota bacterium]
LAGVFGVERVRFAAYELAGVLLWAGTWIGIGYAFSDAVTVIAAQVEKLGLWLVVVVVLLGAYVVSKFLRRRLYLRRLRMPAISPEVLKGGPDAGEDFADAETSADLDAIPSGPRSEVYRPGHERDQSSTWPSSERETRATDLMFRVVATQPYQIHMTWWGRLRWRVEHGSCVRRGCRLQ